MAQAEVFRVGQSDTHGALIHVVKSSQVFGHGLLTAFLFDAFQQASIIIADMMEACQFEEKRDCEQHEVRSRQGRRLNPLDENYWVDQHDEKVCDLCTDDDSVAQVAKPGEFFQREAKGWETHEAHTGREGQVVVWIPYLTCCCSDLIYDIRVRN